MKATRLQIILISDNPLLVNSGLGVGSPMTPEELALYNSIEEARATLAPTAGIPLEFFFMDKFKGNDLPYLEQWHINRYPAIRIWAEYPDGKQGWYNLNQNVLPETYTGEDIAQYVTGLLNGEISESSILCKLFPPLCAIGGYVWLAAAAISTFRAIDARNDAGRIAWGAAATFTWDAFFKGGGFQKLNIGK